MTASSAATAIIGINESETAGKLNSTTKKSLFIPRKTARAIASLRPGDVGLLLSKYNNNKRYLDEQNRENRKRKETKFDSVKSAQFREVPYFQMPKLRGLGIIPAPQF